jgi:hypothetical protein
LAKASKIGEALIGHRYCTRRFGAGDFGRWQCSAKSAAICPNDVDLALGLTGGGGRR